MAIKMLIMPRSFGEDKTLDADIVPTLDARMGTGGGNVPMILQERKNGMDIVRRLTPEECEQLQGYPSGWTKIGTPKEVEVKDYEIKYHFVTDEKGEDQVEIESKELIGTHMETKYYYTDLNGKQKECTDSARYKAIGNSIALPQWWWLFNRMKKYMPENATLGSLFDGMGGFPLTFEELYGSGSARWASEIEEFPICVTKERFKEE